ncbi:uncharacterized protein LOC111356409 isoform X3 [Spodoptera litura]|uniref:Uncharacterized protein LOC111356409 isoform X3 n=1 Tax=Spodoptera litura TaxID=69820 RepID=A0A9J7EEE0_SPOLT|nr:uncharacterized protein LOC111356409 isoform X3 [Spodoptera litura]
MSGTKETTSNLKNKPENRDDKNADPHKAKNVIPARIIDHTDKNNEASSKELHADVSSAKEVPISCQPSQINDHRSAFRSNSIDIANNSTNNMNTSLDVSNAKDLKEGNEVTNKNTADILSKMKPVDNDNGQDINHKSDESTNIDTEYDLSDEGKVAALDFSDSDLPDSPEIETSVMSFEKEVITEDQLSETEQENTSDTEEFNPFVFRKKKSKPKPTVTVDLNTLPSRVSTRYRKPFLENVTAIILKPTYLTEQEAQIDADIVTENIKRLRVYNEFKGDLKMTNENKIDNRNNKTKEVSTTISGTKMSDGKRDDSDKQKQQNKIEMEATSALATTIINRITTSNNKTIEHKPFELACTRLQQEINSSIDKNRCFYKTPEKESSKSPELVGKLRIPQEALEEVLKLSETTQSNLQEPPTRVSTSSDSLTKRKGPRKTKQRQSIPNDSQQEVSTLFRSVVTRSRLKETPKQVSKPSETVITQIRPPNISKPTSFDSAATLNTPLEPPKQVSKPTATQITRSKSRITSLTKVSNYQVELRRPRKYPKQPVSNATDAVVIRNRANKSLITPSTTQESAKQVSLSVLEPLKHELKYPKIVITRCNPEENQKQVSALSKSVVTRSTLKESPKQVSKLSETNTHVGPPEFPKQIPSLFNSGTTRSRSQDPRKKVSKSSEMIDTPNRLPKTTVRRSIPQESQIDVSKSTSTTARPRRTRESKTQIFTRRKPQNIVITQSQLLKSVTTCSRQEKTETTQSGPQKALITQNKPQKAVVERSKPQKTIITRRRLQKTVIAQNKPQQTHSRKKSSSPKAQLIKRERKQPEKNEESTVKASKSVLKNSSRKQITASSAKSPRSLKRSLRSSDAPSAKRTRSHKPSTTSNRNILRKR